MAKVLDISAGKSRAGVGAPSSEATAALKRTAGKQIVRYRRLATLFSAIGRCFEEAADILEVDFAD